MLRAVQTDEPVVVGMLAFGMFKIRSVAGFAFALAFIANPALFAARCTTFSFGQKDVLLLVDGASRTYRFESEGAEFEVKLHLAQGSDQSARWAFPSPVRSALACGERSFVKSASACLDTTTVPIEGTLSVERMGPKAAVIVENLRIVGDLKVMGTKLDNARIELGTLKKKPFATLTMASAKSFDLRELHLDPNDSGKVAVHFSRP